jgi:Ner family transcriptional regulator
MENKLKDTRSLRGWVKFNLSLEGHTIVDLAKEHGITGVSLCTAFYRPFPKAERIIADTLNLQPWDLWPDRYGEDHKPNRKNWWYGRGHCKSNTENFDVNKKILDKDRHETD